MNLVSKARKPPLIMSIKSHFPLSLAYALFRMITILRFYRIDEPIPLHDISFVTVVSKPQSPFVEDPDTEPRQQGKQTLLIMSIKSHFPLSLAYALFRKTEREVGFYR